MILEEKDKYIETLIEKCKSLERENRILEEKYKVLEKDFKILEEENETLENEIIYNESNNIIDA
eukprot:jgi/Orpsp1_1/1183069/evm.model.c7180000083712.1